MPLPQAEMNLDLRTRLDAFDGVHIDTLEAIAESLAPKPQAFDALCELARSDEGKMQSASTWLLKRLLEKGNRLSGEQTTALLNVLRRDGHWEAKLHVLQMLGDLAIGADASPELWAKLSEQTKDKNKLIRAWSYHGLAVIADQHSAYRARAVDWLADGEKDEAASVRARIRRLRKTLAWLRVE